MKATVIRAKDRAELEKKLTEFLGGKPEPTIRFVAQSEYAPESDGLKFNAAWVTFTILWE